PPLPTAWNFPFQPDDGSQTSILMSESLVGFNVAATRQNAGSVANAPAPARPPPAGPRPPAGGVKAPAATGCAMVTAVSGSASEARRSHEVASATNGASAFRRTSTVPLKPDTTYGETPRAKTVPTMNRMSSPSLAGAGARLHCRRVDVLQVT